MNALRCPQCEAPYDSGALSCDQCGFPLPKSAGPKKSNPDAPAASGKAVALEPLTPVTPPPVDIPLPLPKVEPSASIPVAPEEIAPKIPLPDNSWQEVSPKPTEPKTPFQDMQQVAEDWQNTPKLGEKEVPLPLPPVHQPEPRPEIREQRSVQERSSAATPSFPRNVTPPPAKTPSQPRRWKLVVVEGFSVEKEYLIYKDTMVLGRRDADQGVFPDIDLEDQDDGFISRKHAVLRTRDEELLIEDLGGENGTLVDGKALNPHALVTLVEGQVLRLGRVGLLVTRCPQRDQDGMR